MSPLRRTAWVSELVATVSSALRASDRSGVVSGPSPTRAPMRRLRRFQPFAEPRRNPRKSTGNGPSALAVGTTLHASASDQSEQSLHQLAVWLSQRVEDREMISPVDRQQMSRQSALDPRLSVVNRLAA